VKLDTEQSSSPDTSMTFEEEIASATACVQLAKQRRLRRIILLTYIDYHPDLLKMATIPGVDVMIGGHSQTLRKLHNIG
jgi:5'-nucleotidase / UDP-sugar diphosphatase